MSGLSLKFASLLLTASLCLAGSPPTAAAQRGGVRKPLKKQQKTEQPAPTSLPAYTPGPLQPLPLDQVPAVAPHVHFEGGALTIEAHNSTLADVLKAVRQQTGADFEIPSNATERVVADLGPGPARDVLAQLLNGTHFNYVMVGSLTDPTAVQSILLTPKSGAPDTAAAPTRPGMPQRGLSQAAVLAAPADATPAMENEAADDTDAADDQDTAQADQNGQQNPAQQTPKTPEQLLQELQKAQQQQQQPQQTPGQPPQGILPNQPPTAASPNPNKPD